jgi:hypothetical protein
MKSNRKIFLSLLMMLFVLEAAGQPFNYLWAVSLGGRPSYSGRIQAVYNDYGYLYTIGDFQNSQTFGNITLNPVGYQDAYMAIYDTAGQFVFARRWGAPFSYVYAGSITLDIYGYIYVAGSFINQCTIDGQTVSSAGSDDIFLAKLDPLGNVVWLVRAGGSQSDEATSICYYNNTIFMTGSFTSLATFGTINLSSSGVNDRDIFIAAFNINFGNCIWAVKAGGSGEDRGKCIRVDNAGNLILCGMFNNTAFFGSNSVTSQQAGDAFIAKYSTSGQNQWVRSGGSGGNDVAESVGVDQNNNYYITGFINNTATFGTFTVSDNGYGNAFIAKYNSAGTVQWARGGGSSSSDIALDIAVYPTGHSYITGYMNGTANFSGVNIPGIGANDVFIVHYNSSGGVIFGTAIGGASFDQGKSILCNEGGGIVYVMGDYSLSVNFSGTTLTAPQGTWRQFLTRLSSGTLSVLEPATHLLQLHYDGMTNTLNVALPEKVRGQALLTVTDMQGRSVFETTLYSLLAGEVKTLTLPDLNKGIYRTTLYHPQGQYSASFVKAH